MCNSGSKPAAPPPAAPPPPPPAPKPLQIGADNMNPDSTVKKGRESLRIDRTVSGTDSVGSGLNIPV
jgi:hypothetical protein